MRVLFLAYRDSKNPSAAGGDFYLWELAKGLSQMGHRVTYVCSRFEGSEPRETFDGLELVRINGALSLPLKVFHRYLKGLKGGFDIVVEEVIGGQRPPFLAGLFVREPLVAVWHQRHDRIFREQYPLPIAFFLSLLQLFLTRLYRSRVIVTPSHGAKQKLLQLGFKREKVKVVYDGVGEIFYKARASKKRENVIVWLGKLRRYKRVDHALLAFKGVHSVMNKPCRLVVAGKVSEIDRGYVEWLRRLAERLEIADNVEFRVNVSEIEKLKLLEKARLLVQPSPVEGFSIVVAEANRCGTPVVVSDGIPSDVVVDGQNGLVYPFGDVAALEAAISELMKDDAMWSEMSKNAYEWSKQFTWKSSVLEFVRILKSLCSRQTITDQLLD